MRAAGEHDDFGIAYTSANQLPRMAHRRRWRPTPNLRIRSLVAAGRRIGENAQAAAEHHANRCLTPSSIPAMQADMKFAMVPHAKAFIPMRAKSDFRVGTSAPMPPS